MTLYSHLLAVAFGGALGAVLRACCAAWIGPQAGALSFPWATFAINVGGSLLIGCALGVLERGSLGWSLLVVGVLGGFTTFSGVSLELLLLLKHGAYMIAGAYAAASILVGLVAAFLGYVLCHAPH